MKKSLLAFLLSGCIGISLAQTSNSRKETKDYKNYPYWIEMMQDPQANFFETQKAFNVYWKGREIKKGGGYKPFKRWEHFMAQQVDEKGNRPQASQILNEIQSVQNANVESLINSTNSEWEEVGPVLLPANGTGQPNGLGRINAIGFHPTDANTFFAGAPAGGLWKTTDGGSSWSSSTDGLATLGVSSIVVDNSDPNLVFIGTGDRDANDAPGLGIFKSTDGGNTWSQSNSGMGNRTVGELVQDPTNSDVFIAATNGGIYRSSNGGTNWSQSQSGNFKDLKLHPSNSSIVYATSGGLLYKSTNNGVSFSLSMTGIPTGKSRLAIGVSPASPNTIYVLAAQGSVYGGLFKSTNSGASFSTQSTSPNIMDYSTNGSGSSGQAWYDMCIAVNPTNANDVYVGGVNVFRSTNSGSSWTINAHWVGSGGVTAIHADQHILRFSPAGKLYVGNDGGVYNKNTSNENWNNISSGLAISQCYKIGQSQTDVDRVIVGYQDNGTGIYDNGNWRTEIGGDGMESAIDYSNSAYMYGELYYGAIRRSTNNGVYFSSIAGNGVNGITESGAWVTPYVLHEQNPNTMFIGYQDIWRSTNVKTSSPSSVSWTEISNNLGGSGKFTFLEHNESNGNILYAVKGSSMYKSENVMASNVTWTTVSVPGSGTILSVETSELNENIVYLSRGSKIYQSNDKGASWTNITGNISNSQYKTSLVYAPMPEARGLYVSTDYGVFFKPENESDWITYSNGLPNYAKIKEIELYEDSSGNGNHKIRAASYGRGLWSNSLYLTGNVVSVDNNTTNVCTGSSATINADNAQSYFWTNPAGVILSTTNVLTVTPTSTTVYTVNGIMANGDTTQAFATVNVLNPTVSILGQTSICTGNSTTLTASVSGLGSYTYVWSNGQTGASISVSPSVQTTYSVTATSTEGCTASQSHQVGIVANADYVIVELKTDNYPSETSWTLKSNSGNILFSKNQGSYTNSNTIYRDTVFCITDLCLVFDINDSYGDGICCSYGQGHFKIFQSDGVLLSNGGAFNSSTSTNFCIQPQVFNLSVLDSNITACSTESVTFTASGGDSYYWTNSAGLTVSNTSTLTVSESNSTNYTVFGIQNGDTLSHQVSLSIEEINVTITGNANVCEGDLVTLTANGGDSYSWSNSSVGSSVNTFTAISSTTVSVYGVSSTGCLDTNEISIVVTPTPTVVLSTDNSACFGDDITITASGSDSYLWSTGETTSSILVSGSNAGSTLNSVWVIGESNGCSSDTMISNLTWLPNPVVTVNGNTEYCVGESVQISVSGADDYIWSNGSVSNILSFVATADTSFTVSGMTNGCNSTSVNINIIVHELPTVIITGDTEMCEGDSITLLASGATDYSWSNGMVGSSIQVLAQDITLSVTGTTNGCSSEEFVTLSTIENPEILVTGDNQVCLEDSIVLTVSGADSYNWSNGMTGSTVTLFNTSATNSSSISVIGIQNGCNSNEVVTNLIWMSNPNVSITGDTEMCEGDTIELTASGADTYLWSTGHTSQSIDFVGLSNSTITVEGFLNGCLSSIVSHDITVNSKPIVDISGNGTICMNDSVELTASGSDSYVWSTGQTGSTIMITPNSSISVTVQGTSISGCMSEIETFDIIVNSNPIIQITGNTSVCEGDSVELTVSGADSYVWSTGQTSSSITVLPNTTTLISVQGTNTNGCVSLEETHQITLNPNPEVEITGDNSVCLGDSIQLSATGADSYLWSNGQTGSTISVLLNSSNSISVQGTNLDGCISLEANHQITVNALPEVTVVGNDTICIGETVVLTASGADTYLWSDGQIGSTVSITPLESTTISVTGTTNGCESINVNQNIVVNEMPIITIVGDTEACLGDSIILMATGGDSFTWSTGETTASIIVYPTSNETISVTGMSNGCTGSTEVDVNVIAAPIVLITGNTNVCIGELVTLTASGADSYLWSNGSTGQTVSIEATDSMVVSVVGTISGCASSSESIQINTTTNSSYFVIEIRTDWYGYETTWELEDALGNTVAEHTNANGGYYQNNSTYFDTVYCALIGDCYTFKIKDSYGDGMCCSYGQGYYNITQSDGTVLATGGNFNYSETKDFCISEPIFALTMPFETIEVCAGDSFEVISSGADSYTWMDVSGNIMSETEALNMACISSSIYTVVGISGNDTAMANVEVIVDEMNLTISGSEEICKGDKVWIHATGGLVYNWSTGQTSSWIQVNPTETTTYTVTSTSANGCEFTAEHTIVVLDTYKAKIVMKTDWYPYETSWKLKDSSGNIVATNNQTYNQTNKKYNQWVNCLPDECYTLEVYDSYGDGMCCFYGYGYFKVIDENGTVLANGGQFGSQTSAPFCFNGSEAAALPFDENDVDETPFMVKTDGSIITEEKMNDIQLYPNPAINEITIDAMSSESLINGYEITDVMGRVLESYTYEKAIKKSILNISSYLSGNYIIKIHSNDGVKLIKFIKN